MDHQKGLPMLIKSEYDLQFHLPVPTPMVAMLHLHPSVEPAVRAGNELKVEHIDRDTKTDVVTNDRSLNGKFNRDGNLATDSPNNRTTVGKLNLQSGVFDSKKLDSKKAADEAWVKRFGKSDGTPGDRSQRESSRACCTATLLRFPARIGQRFDQPLPSQAQKEIG